MSLHSSAGRAPQRERRGHGFESRRGYFAIVQIAIQLRWSHVLVEHEVRAVDLAGYVLMYIVYMTRFHRQINQYQYKKIRTWLRGLGRGIKQKKSHRGSGMNISFLLFYSPKLRNQVLTH